MIETPIDAAEARSRIAIEHDIVALAAELARARARSVDCVDQAAGLARSAADDAAGRSLGIGWAGAASRAFSTVTGHLAANVARADDQLGDALRFVDAARWEVVAGV